METVDQHSCVVRVTYRLQLRKCAQRGPIYLHFGVEYQFYLDSLWFINMMSTQSSIFHMYNQLKPVSNVQCHNRFFMQKSLVIKQKICVPQKHTARSSQCISCSMCPRKIAPLARIPNLYIMRPVGFGTGAAVLVRLLCG